MPHRARTPDRQTGSQAGLLLTRLSLALNRLARADGCADTKELLGDGGEFCASRVAAGERTS
eukprot:scaffold49596_cov24-Phaeocystis_antarctica.AAC.1